jgi:nucleoid-associated protein YgaU
MFDKRGREGCQMRNTNNKKRKKYRIKSKFRFITSLVIMAAIVICIFGAVTGLSVSTALTKPQYTNVTITAGDTLWDIAETYMADDMDVRKAVYELCKYNDINASDLTPGMVIKVPEIL